MFQREKAETTQAHTVVSLHAGVVLPVISVFLQLNIRYFVHKKISYYVCLISQILR